MKLNGNNSTKWDKELYEWFENFCDEDTPYNGLKTIVESVYLEAKEQGAMETLKAFGGCTKCYGKGYGTQTLNYSSRRHREQAPTMVFCTCDRGKQLKQLTPQE